MSEYEKSKPKIIILCSFLFYICAVKWTLQNTGRRLRELQTK
jgi:hypothetical protein